MYAIRSYYVLGLTPIYIAAVLGAALMVATVITSYSIHYTKLYER